MVHLKVFPVWSQTPMSCQMAIYKIKLRSMSSTHLKSSMAPKLTTLLHGIRQLGILLQLILLNFWIFQKLRKTKTCVVLLSHSQLSNLWMLATPRLMIRAHLLDLQTLQYSAGILPTIKLITPNQLIVLHTTVQRKNYRSHLMIGIILIIVQYAEDGSKSNKQIPIMELFQIFTLLHKVTLDLPSVRLS